jgi:hypothetical protein
MASKQDKERESGTEILDAAAPRPEATPQAAPRVLNDSEQRQADAYQREAGRQQQEAAAAAPRIDEVQPGGQYEVDGRLVDAEGHAL